MAIDIVGVVDKGTNTLKPINELLRCIQAIMGNAKDEEPEQNQLPPPPKQITGPSEGNFSRDLDDDIPF